MRNKLFTLLFAVLASVGMTKAEVYSGTCGVDGDNLTWSLNTEDSTLVITGTGAMTDFAGTGTNVPWYSYRENIAYVSLPEGLTSIGYYAFMGASRLHGDFVIPKGVTLIGNGAFSGCSSLTSIEIPKNVTDVGDATFYGCSSLTSIVWNAKNCSYCTAFYRPPYDPPGFSLNVQNIIFGEEVEYIPNGICKGMSKLTNIEFSNSITSIGLSAFQYCTSLTSVTIGNSVTSIGESAFYGCSSLTSINIPESVTKIERFAFNDCKNLTNIESLNSITSIDEYAFGGCKGLTNLDAFNGVISIGQYAFAGCIGLMSIEIPESVTSIGRNAFYFCTGLISVTFHNNVTSVEPYAFNYCSNLASVIYTATTPPTFGENVYNACSKLSSMVVPCGSIDAYSQALPDYASLFKNPSLGYSITGNILPEGAGNIITPPSMCDDTIITATPHYGYHFTQWSDGVTDNPRLINLIQDTTFTAVFAPNEYTITTKPANEERGTTAGDGIFLYLEQAEIYATPNYGYHFTQWKDGATDNPRVVTVIKDETYEAVFAKNIYTISPYFDPIMGTVSGPANAEYLEDITITATPNEGYHFVQWSDGNTENPRTFTLTGDSIITAEFVPNTYTLNVSCDEEQGAIEGESGSFDYLSKHVLTANAHYGYTFDKWSDGVTDNPRTLVLTHDTTITALFNINHYPIMFLNWNGERLSSQSVAYNHAAEAPQLPEREGYIFMGWTADIEHIIDTTFAIALYDKVGVEVTYKAEDGETIFSEHADLHIPNAPTLEGKTFAGWLTENIDKNGIVLRATYTLDNPTADDDVTVVPGSNSANVTFPFVTGAITYVLVIRDLFGHVVCKIMFNASGRLLGIAFAPSRERSQTSAQTDNFQFTVEGLDPSTTYEYEFVAHSETDDVIETLAGSFTTTAEIPTDLSDVQGDNVQCSKVVMNDQVLILRGEKVYTVQGQEVK